MTPARPPFAVIGAQRARSTAMLDLIRTHPEVAAPPAELGYFEDPVWADRDPEVLARIVDPGGRRVGGFKRPELLGRPECPPRLAATLPDVRMIAVLREPVARTVSAYFHYMRVGILPVRPPEEGLSSLLDDPGAAGPQGPEVLSFSRYGECLARYAEHFPIDQVLVMTEHDLDRDLDGRMSAVWRHIGVAPSRITRPDGTGRSGGTYSLTRTRLLRVGSMAQYRWDAPTGLRAARPGLLPRAANRAVAELDRKVFARAVHEPDPTLSPALRRRLEEHFAPDLRLLGEILGRDLTDWTRAAPT